MQYVSSPTSITCIVSPLVLLDSATALGVSSVHRRFFKRIKGAEWTSPALLERKGWITGIVTRCVSIRRRFLPPPVPEQSTGAQLRIEWVMRTTSISRHTPGFGWRGPFKFRHVPTNQKGAKTPNEVAAAGVLTSPNPNTKNPSPFRVQLTNTAAYDSIIMRRRIT